MPENPFERSLLLPHDRLQRSDRLRAKPENSASDRHVSRALHFYFGLNAHTHQKRQHHIANVKEGRSEVLEDSPSNFGRDGMRLEHHDRKRCQREKCGGTGGADVPRIFGHTCLNAVRPETEFTGAAANTLCAAVDKFTNGFDHVNMLGLKAGLETAHSRVCDVDRRPCEGSQNHSLPDDGAAPRIAGTVDFDHWRCSVGSRHLSVPTQGSCCVWARGPLGFSPRSATRTAVARPTNAASFFASAGSRSALALARVSASAGQSGLGIGLP